VILKVGHECTYTVQYTLEKINLLERRKAGTEICCALSEKSLKLENVFKEASRNFIFSFLFIKAGKKFRNYLRNVHVQEVY
jgi:hypothetical protein